MVMVHNEINITCKDHPTDYGTRREKKRGQIKNLEVATVQGGERKRKRDGSAAQQKGILIL